MNWNEWTIVFAWRVSDRPSVLFDCLLFHEGPFNLSQSTVKYRHSKIVLIWNKWSSGSAQKRPVSKTGYSLCHFVNLPVLKPRVAEKLVKMAEDIFIFFWILRILWNFGKIFSFYTFFPSCEWTKSRRLDKCSDQVWRVVFRAYNVNRLLTIVEIMVVETTLVEILVNHKLNFNNLIVGEVVIELSHE